MMKTSEQLLELVNDRLREVGSSRRPVSLYDPIGYVLSIGGKRLRPVLMLLAYNMYKETVEDIVGQAVGIEVYHNYTLLHDDLMDNAPMRRGHETVHLRWNANQAILSGDSMLVLAYQYMSHCSSEKLQQVIDLFTTTALEIGEGQQYDMDFEHRNDVSEDEYIEMIRLKTSVLLACALKIGALLAGASASDCENIYRFGELVGLAFQLQDDYLDVYGDPKVFGKAIGGDILCNKKTYMLINALAKADSEQRRQLEYWIAQTPQEGTAEGQEKIKAITNLYNQIGIDKMAQVKIAAFFEQSRKYLDAIGVSDERKQYLKAYVEQMMKREY